MKTTGRRSQRAVARECLSGSESGLDEKPGTRKDGEADERGEVDADQGVGEPCAALAGDADPTAS